METVGVEPTSSALQARRSSEVELHPLARDGLQPEQGGRPDSNRYREDHDLGCCRYTTATMQRGRPDSNRRPIA